MENNIHEVFQSLGVPAEIAKTYERIGLRSLYPWQAECLYTTSVLRGNNLVYCAPTSGGKTLVAELVLLKTVISLQKKVIFILPYVSLVIDKEKHLNRVVALYNQTQDNFHKIKVKAYYGDKGMSKSYKENIIICTIEKANIIFNTLVLRQRANQLGAVILDETHVLGNKLNGYLLEILITKIKIYERKQQGQRAEFSEGNPPCRIQVIALSATMGNVSELASWLNAKLYTTDYRPIPLLERIKAGNSLYSTTGELQETIPTLELVVKEDPDGIAYLCKEGLIKGQQIIIFCPTKQQCVETAQMLSKLLSVVTHENDYLKREEIYQHREKLKNHLYVDVDESIIVNGVSNPPTNKHPPKVISLPPLAETLICGIAYHHSGLSSEERQQIEKAFRSGMVSILCATTTLAAGVNLPAGRVIIRSLMLGKDLLTITNYKQMSGRAGRKGQTQYGESILVVKPSQLSQALQLVQQMMPNIVSQIHPDNDGGNAFVKAIVDLIGLEICSSFTDICQFILDSLLYQQAKNTPEIQEKYLRMTENCVQFLVETKVAVFERYPEALSVSNILPSSEDLSNGMIKPTKFGKALLRSGLDPDEAIIFYESLLQGQNCLYLDNSLHVLYLLAPYDQIQILPNYQKLLVYYEKSSKLGTVFHKFLNLIGLQYQILHKWQLSSPTKYEIDMSSQLVRLRGISSSVGTQLNSTTPTFKGGNKDWNLICSSKRLWIAMILQSLLDGYPVEQVMKEFLIDQQMQETVETVSRNSQMIAAKLERFCKEMGWTGLMKVIHHMKEQLQDMVKVPKECKKLLAIPNLHRRVAKVLAENHINTPEDIVQYSSVEEIAQYLQLSLGFELQEIQTSELGFEPELIAGPFQQISNNMGAKMSRDEFMREKFSILARTVMESAKEVVLSKRSKSKSHISSNISETSSSPSTHPKGTDKTEDASHSLISHSIVPNSSNQEDRINRMFTENAEEEEIGDSDSGQIDEDLDTITDSEEEPDESLDEEISLSTEEEIFDDCDDLIEPGSLHFFPERNNPQNPGSIGEKGFLSPTKKIDGGKTHSVAIDLMTPSKTGGIRRLKITPFKQNHKAEAIAEFDQKEMFVSDDELIRMMEEFENSGVLQSNLSKEGYLPGQSDFESGSTACLTSAELLENILNPVDSTSAISFIYFPLEDPVEERFAQSNRENLALRSKSETFTAQLIEIEMTSSTARRNFPILKADEFCFSPSLISTKLDETETETENEIAQIELSVAESSDEIADNDLLSFMDNWEKSHQVAKSEQHLPQPILTQTSIFMSQSIPKHEDPLALLANNSMDFYALCSPSESQKSEINHEKMELAPAREIKSFHLSDELSSVELHKRTVIFSPDLDLKLHLQDKIEIPFTERKQESQMPKKSPYLTPFTASKIATPGKYLYYGLYPNGEKSDQKDLRNYGQMNNNSNALNENGIKQSFGRVDFSETDPVSSSASQKITKMISVTHLNTVEACKKFINFLQTSNSLSFELIFRNFPNEFLSFWKRSSSPSQTSNEEFREEPSHDSERKPDSIMQGWSSLLTQNLFPALNVTCSHYDLNIPTPLLSTNPPSKGGFFASANGGQSSSAMILTGVAINFGTTESFILRLPQVLPVLFSDFAVINPAKVEPGSKASLDRLPIKLKEKICVYIGFPHLLFKSFPLFSYLNTGRFSSSSDLHSLDQEDSYNPLFYLSKHWCFVARRSLILQWRKGGCMEWKLLQEIMNQSSSLTRFIQGNSSSVPALIASNMKLKVQYLRDRDIFINAVLEDPLIAKEILLYSGEVDQNCELKPTFSTSSSARIKKSNSKPLVYPLNLLPRYQLSELIHYHDQEYSKVYNANFKLSSYSSSNTVMPNLFLLSSSKSQSSFRDKYPYYHSRGCAIASYLAYYNFLAMKVLRVELVKSKQFTLFQNIEMPLISVIADSEYHGVEVDAQALQIIRQQWQHRKLWITSFFQQLLQFPKINLDAVDDVRRIKQLILQHHYQPLTVVNRNLRSGSSSATKNKSIIDNQRDRSDWSAGKRKRSEYEDKENFFSIQSISSFTSSTSSVKSSSFMSSDQFLDQHPFYCLVKEYRSLGRCLPMLHSILKFRRFCRVRGDYHSIGTETGRIIISSPPLQQIPKENLTMSIVHPTLAEEMMKMNTVSNSLNKDVSDAEIANRMKMIIQSINQNILKSRQKRNYEWVKIVPWRKSTENESMGLGDGNFSFYSPNLIMGKLLFIFQFTVQEQYYLDINSNSALNPALIAVSCSASKNSLLEEFKEQKNYFHLPESFYPLQSSVDKIYQVLVELPSSPSKFIVLPSSHIYRLQSQVLSHSSEQQILLTLANNRSLSQPLLKSFRDFQNCFEAYRALYRKIELRKSFIASPGYILLAIDYCQIELRLLAHFCQDDQLLAAFHSNSSIEEGKYDIFERLASIYKRKPLSHVTKVDRTEIKQLCYAVIYGAGAGLIAEQLSISSQQAQQLITDFHKRFPTILQFIEQLYEESSKVGYVETLLGRKRALLFHKLQSELEVSVCLDETENIDCSKSMDDGDWERFNRTTTIGRSDSKSKDWKLKSRLQRQVINSLCQGSAADLVKLAMVNIHHKLQALYQKSIDLRSSTLPFHYRSSRSNPGSGLYRQFDDCRLLLQIHDELVYEVQPDHLYEVAKIIKDCMESAVILKVPLQVKLKKGMDWQNMTEFSVEDYLHISSSPVVDEDKTIANVGNPLLKVDDRIVKALFKDEP